MKYLRRAIDSCLLQFSVDGGAQEFRSGLVSGLSFLIKPAQLGLVDAELDNDSRMVADHQGMSDGPSSGAIIISLRFCVSVINLAALAATLLD